MEKIVFCPQPQHIAYTGEERKAPAVWRAHLPEELAGLRKVISSVWSKLQFASSEEADIRLESRKYLGSEAYAIHVDKAGITLFYAEAAGAFYGMMTLRQLLMQCTEEVPCCRIEDAPGLGLRGVLLDISRGKVPKLDTLKEMADMLASFKINHLELYVEGFSFGYPSFPQVWEEEGCLTAEELRELSKYCRSRFIDLVPHQNSLGHMASWLSRTEYVQLAEAPEGLDVMGMKFPPTTMDASDPETLQLLKRMIEDLSHSFDSEYFHAGLDEAFEFCKGKNRKRAETEGEASVILPYICALHDFLQEKGFKMMMWDDFPVKYPELLEKLPEDIMILDWGYDREFPVEQRAEALQKAGRAFCLCPGTSSWSSFTGLTDNMLENVERTGKAAYTYGAQGLVVTDWGDMNHFQYQPVSYAGILYGAAWAWNEQGLTEKGLTCALDRFVFQDSAEIMGEFCLSAGRFYEQEEFRMPCRSIACLPLIFGRLPKAKYEAAAERLVKSVRFFSPDEVCEAYLTSYENRSDFDGEKLYGYLEEKGRMLAKASLNCGDAEVIVREYKNALRMLFYLTKVREQIEREDSVENTAEACDHLLDQIKEEHILLWRLRNKESGLKNGLDMFEKLRVKG